VADRPPWIGIAVAVFMAQAGAAVFSRPIGIGVGAIGISLILGLLLLRANRLAWVIVVVGAGGQLIEGILSGPNILMAAFGCVVLGCVLAPASVRYIWIDRSQGGASRLLLRKNLSWSRLVAPAYGTWAKLAGWEVGEGPSPVPIRSYRVLLWRLGCACVGLFIVFVIAYNVKHGVAQGSMIADVIARVSRIAYVLVQMLFFIVVLVAISRRASSSANRARVK
jgi:hypothetical protein